MDGVPYRVRGLDGCGGGKKKGGGCVDAAE